MKSWRGPIMESVTVMFNDDSVMKTNRRAVELWSWWSSETLFLFYAACIVHWWGWLAQVVRDAVRSYHELGTGLDFCELESLLSEEPDGATLLAGSSTFVKDQLPWFFNRRLFFSVYAAIESAFIKCRLIKIWSRQLNFSNFKAPSPIWLWDLRHQLIPRKQVEVKFWIYLRLHLSSHFFNRHIDET